MGLWEMMTHDEALMHAALSNALANCHHGEDAEVTLNRAKKFEAYVRSGTAEENTHCECGHAWREHLSAGCIVKPNGDEYCPCSLTEENYKYGEEEPF